MGGGLEIRGNAKLARAVRPVICAAIAAAIVGAPPRARASDAEPLDPGTPPPVGRAEQPARAGADAVDHAWIAAKGAVGLFPVAAARVQVFLGPAGKVRAILEGDWGIFFGGPAWGGGLRAQIELARGARDALLLSPGVELWKEPPTEPGLFGHSNTLRETIVDADLSWLHVFASHVEWELGLRAGVVTGDDTDGGDFVGPSFGLFTGMRF